MPAPTQFRKLDAAHAQTALEALLEVWPHLEAATEALETGVPCRDCKHLRMIITFVDCATSLVQEAIERLANWPEDER